MVAVRKRRLIVAALIAALAAGMLVVSLGSGSSHREAPAIALDPDRRQHRRLRVHRERRAATR